MDFTRGWAESTPRAVAIKENSDPVAGNRVAESNGYPRSENEAEVSWPEQVLLGLLGFG